MKFNIKQNKFNFKTKYATIKEYPELENIEITPSKEEQTFKSENYYGYDEVKVNPVTNEVDENIKPENIKEGISILGVSGNANILNGEELIINKNGEYIPTEPMNAYTKVIVDVPNDTSDATATAGDIATGKTAYISSGLVEGTGTISTPVTKGLVINSYDDEGYPTDISIVGLTEIPDYYFYYTMAKKTSIYGRVGGNLHFPDNLKKLGDYCLAENANLTLASLPESLTSIGNYCFYNSTNITLASLPESLTSVGNSAFRTCSKIALTSLPSGLISIGTNGFYNCKAITIKSIPSGITSIGSSAFYGCTGLTTLAITGAITSIGSSAFSGCSNLSDLRLPNVTSVPTISSNSLSSTPIASGTGYIYVPDSLVDSFKSATNWSTYADQIKGVSEL